LAIFGSTAGSLLDACGAGVVTAIENVRRRRTPRYPNLMKLQVERWRITPSTNYRGCSDAKEKLQRRKNQRMTKKGSSGRNFFSKYSTPKRSFASALHSFVEAKQPSENQKVPQVSRRNRSPMKIQVSERSKNYK
jgi:hypothetical protein